MATDQIRMCFLKNIEVITISRKLSSQDNSVKYNLQVQEIKYIQLLLDTIIISNSKPSGIQT